MGGWRGSRTESHPTFSREFCGCVAWGGFVVGTSDPLSKGCARSLLRVPSMSSRAATAAALLLAFGLAPRAARAADPIGYLDGASCEGMVGWAQDPDAPDAPIDVHIYFGGPAGTPGAPAVATRAEVHRDDLCAAIGSCAHGYGMRSPFSLHDGLPHPIHAYGIDTGGGNNPQLGNSPRELVCAPAASGFRRKVTSSGSFDRWHFDSFWDVLPLDAASAEALPEGPDFPEAPDLVNLESTPGDAWVVDGGVRRQLTAELVASWRVDLSNVEILPDADFEALVEGPPLRARPLLFIHDGLWLVDDELPDAPPPSETTTTGSGEGGAGSGGGRDVASGTGGATAGTTADAGAGGADEDEEAAASTSGCQVARGTIAPSLASLAWLLAAAVYHRRRCSPAPSSPRPR